jgi:hypothetical protein
VLSLVATACGGRTSLSSTAADNGVVVGREAGVAGDARGDHGAGGDAAVSADGSLRRGRWLVFGGTHRLGIADDQLFGVLLGDSIGPLQTLSDRVLVDVAWSADGRYLAYAQGSELRVLEHVGDALVPRRSLSPASSYSVPRWSPVASIVAWSAAVDGRDAVLFTDVRGDGAPAVIAAEGRMEIVEWSADGRYLAIELAGPNVAYGAPALADTSEQHPVVRALPHGGASNAGFVASMSLDGKYVEYRGAGVDERWVAPLVQPEAAIQVVEIVWQESGGFVELSGSQAARLASWTDASWSYGPWTQAPSPVVQVSSAGYLVASCPEGFCVGRVGDDRLAPWYGGSLGIGTFSPDGQQLIVQENLVLVPQVSSWLPARLHHIDLAGEWGRLTALADFEFQFGSLSTSYRWSPTSDAFVVAFEGGTAGVVAWRRGDPAGTSLAEANPHRFRASTGAWAPGGRDLVLAYRDDDGASQETEIHVFRIEQGQVAEQAVFAAMARAVDVFRWHWQP